MRSRWLKAIAVFALGALLATAVLARIRFAPQADIGAGLVAKQVCSCVFVGGRDEQACRLDLQSDLDPVRSEQLADGIACAQHAIASGAALNKLEQLVAFPRS